MAKISDTSDELREKRLVDWYASPQGEKTLALLREVLAELLSTRFGYLGIQVGGGAINPSLAELSRVREHVLVSTLPDRGDIRASPLALPVASECADLLLLLHTVENASDPYQVLRELERVLVPEGDAVMVSFNPWSIWGMSSWFVGRLRGDVYAPWQGRFYTQRRLKDWFRLLGFELVTVRRFGFRSPSWHGWFEHRCAWMEKVGPRWFPALGGVQIIIARKRRTRLTLIKSRWRPLSVRVGGRVAGAASRSVLRVED
ncbi:methyltransferase domain-containing protein [Acidihalobacter ferrooxydans]|uniref:Methyltransferase type 11 domain-containing protein n=1 Tax=Acidihalobacter ferrooxydans TaxID=1765967 RepID=A0A1P8UEE3_9GAMM|nr:methyltransferase domain-containing protein [Acidihalobacter ferrooxydans]APZ42222.1 hypothetical protein BW247_03205 [Acidihalobacter ferrooxydans]